jgi:hypothetical protein
MTENIAVFSPEDRGLEKNQANLKETLSASESQATADRASQRQPIVPLWQWRKAMLTQARSTGRIRGYPRRHQDGGARPEMPTDLPRLPNGSIDYDLFKLRAQQLRRAMLAAMVADAWRGLVRAFHAAAAVIRQLARRRRSRASNGTERFRTQGETRRTEPRRAA